MNTELTEVLIAGATLLQTLEYFQIRGAFSSVGIWRPKTMARDLGSFLSLFLARRSSFHVILAIRLLAGFFLWVSSFLFTHVMTFDPSLLRGSLLLILAVTTLLISIRFRGSFNGGSDSMTLLVCLCLGLSHLTGSAIFLGYLALQTALSYFVSGLVKIRNSNWRQGRALTAFAKTPGYESPNWALALFQKPKLAMALSWAVMLFELSFPVAFVSPTLCGVFLSIGFFFHLSNAYVLGLNRFFFAWIATYPILFGLSSLLQIHR